MKKLLSILMMCLIPFCIICQPDCRFFNKSNYHQSAQQYDLDIGMDSIIQLDIGQEPSFIIFSDLAAGKFSNLNPGSYPEMFVWSKKNTPGAIGTDQYEGTNVKLSCLVANDNVPQPNIFVPIERNNVHPATGQIGLDLIVGHKMCIIKKAFFWENAEDLDGWHGPYGNIYISSFEEGILNFTLEELSQNESLWSAYLLNDSKLAGPIWAGYAPLGYPDPRDEWIDGPFGTMYSNFAIHDWGTSPNDNETIVIGVRETDGSPGDDFMGYEEFTAGEMNPKTIFIESLGWVEVQNIWVSGQFPLFEDADVYWYGGWDGEYPVDVYGPQSDAVPNQNSYGNQYKPFTNSLFWDFHNNNQFNGYRVGLLGGKFPIGVYDEPRIYDAIDQPAIFDE